MIPKTWAYQFVNDGQIAPAKPFREEPMKCLDLEAHGSLLLGRKISGHMQSVPGSHEDMPDP
jgi:hypothetical protein